MECAICYNKFFKPKSKEELQEILNKNIPSISDNNVSDHTFYDSIIKFDNFLITSNHNTTHSCCTFNCPCLICRDCWNKITFPNQDTEYLDLTFENININDFKCPYCRIVQWKDYMRNVLLELKYKVLNREDFRKSYYTDITIFNKNYI